MLKLKIGDRISTCLSGDDPNMETWDGDSYQWFNGTVMYVDRPEETYSRYHILRDDRREGTGKHKTWEITPKDNQYIKLIEHDWDE